MVIHGEGRVNNANKSTTAVLRVDGSDSHDETLNGIETEFDPVNLLLSTVETIGVANDGSDFILDGLSSCLVLL